MKNFKKIAVLAFGLMTAGLVQADLGAEVQTKVQAQVVQLEALAKNPVIIAAAKAGAADKAMNNARWQDLAESDTAVKAVSNNEASNILETSSNANISKIHLRDENGLWVAGKSKPFIYNISNRPNYKVAITGKNFIAPKIKKDPSTGEDAVQVAVPVMDGGKVVGVLHAGIKP